MSEFRLPPSLSIVGNREIAERILSEIWGGRGIFTCTVANTLTSTIPGVSDAGDTPELTLFTPAADAEMLVCGKTLCMDGIPINPGGIPTPATLTMAALELSGMPVYIVNGGCKIAPKIPCFDVGGECGDYISTGKAVKNVREGFEKGKILGRMLSKGNDFLVVSESCAGGTTTALAVLTAMGATDGNHVSSSSPKNPRELKMRLVEEALSNASIKRGDLAKDPLRAIACVGDPMMPANVGIIIGAAERIPVIVGGGTQMAAVIAAALALEPSIAGRIIHGTTRWLVKDPNSNVTKLISDISPDVPLVYINMDYSDSPHEGLQAYEWGYIKEGVGCGGACVAAVAASEGKIDCPGLLDKVHEIYENIINP